MVRGEFYSAVAQVIPVLVLAIALQTQDVASIGKRSRDRRGQADAASKSFVAAVNDMADGRRPIETLSRYEQMQLVQAVRFGILSDPDARRLAPMRWTIAAGGLSEMLTLASLWFGLAWWPVDIGIILGLFGCTLVLGLLMWARLGGKDLLLDSPLWSRDLFPEVTDDQAKDHQRLLDFFNQALASGILTKGKLEELLAKYESKEAAAGPGR